VRRHRAPKSEGHFISQKKIIINDLKIKNYQKIKNVEQKTKLNILYLIKIR
jgi:hypothetical protein